MRLLLLISLVFSEATLASVIDEIAQSGRCATLSDSPDSRVAPVDPLVPGQPPLLSFRTYEGKLHQRFGNSDLMLDDAGH